MTWATRVKAETPVEYVPATVGKSTDTVIPSQPRVWSKQQRDIFEWFKGGTQNLIVRARAGTGKTTTILEGISGAPEEEILLAAFNKRIAEALTANLNNPKAEAKTLHAIGYQLVREYWGGMRVARNDDRAKALTDKVCGAHVPETIKKLVSKLHTKGREIMPYAVSAQQLLPLAEQFECEPDVFWMHQGYDLEFVCKRAMEVMTIAAQDKPKEGIDFADMIYLPLRNQWAMGKYGLVVVDEAQDMTVAQLDLARKVLNPDGRICIVGDDRQAIYGFRGADSGSLDRLKRDLDAVELGLTTTYRCGQAIVAIAQTMVPDIEAGAGVSEGIIRVIERDRLVEEAQLGDFILSRLNAPLAGYAMQLLRRGIRAQIAGRDIGNGLKALVRKLSKGVYTVEAFLDAVDVWREKETLRLRRLKFLDRASLVEDQAETLYHLSDGAQSVNDINVTIDTLFSDEGPDTRFVLLSSVHKAKGLEADRVFALDWTFNAKNVEEQNIRYVAVTRARHELIFVE